MNRQEWNETLENFPAERFQKCNLDCMQKWKALQDLNAHTYSNQKTLDHNQLKTWHKMSKIAKTKKADIDS